MTESAKDADVVELLTRYSFDLSGHSVDRLTGYWLSRYPQSWVRLAVIEALYQGRYKAISVEQILNLWRRRGKPLHHFNSEFERIICNRFPKTLRSFESSARPRQSSSPAAAAAKVDSSYRPSPPAPQSSAVKPETAIEPVPTADPVAPALSAEEQLEEQTAADKTAANGFEALSAAEVEQLLSWSRMNAGKHPIHQFVPVPEASDFYSKLKAVAHDTIVRNESLGRNRPTASNTPDEESNGSKLRF